MTVFMVETLVVKPDKLGEAAAFDEKFEALMKKRPDLFKEIKSVKHFSHFLGGNSGGRVMMWEFESLADVDKFLNRCMGDKEWMTKFYPELAALMVPGTHSLNVWTPIP
jgi:hypothetical protein